MGLAFVPLYIKYLGIEAYGLIGIFSLLQAWLSLFDLGITPTLNREMARFKGGAHDAQAIRDVLRSIECIAFVVACLITFSIYLTSNWLASGWLRAEELPTVEVVRAFDIMGIVTALRLLDGVYRSSLMGLQRQVLYNVVNSAMATLRWLGAVAVLAWGSPTIETFFLWQGAVSVLTLVAFARATYLALPLSERGGRFSRRALKSMGLFALGISGISFLGLLLTQIDKVLLSRLLTLSDYGYYSLATVVAGGLYMLVVPVIQTYSPLLNELHACGDQARLIKAYHTGAQLVTVIVGSASVILISYANVILNLWTQNSKLASNSAVLLAILCFGNLLNCFMWVPYQTQLVHGWTSLSVTVNSLLVVFIVPALFWTTPRFGAEGAAWTWVSMNVAYVFFSVYFMHKKILPFEKWRWYFKDILGPLSGAAAVAIPSAWIMPNDLMVLSQLGYLILSSALTLLAAALTVPELRFFIYRHLHRIFCCALDDRAKM